MTTQHAGIIRPSRIKDQFTAATFIPANSQQQLIAVDLGFANNPLYKQEKLLIFLNDNIYYQKLVLTDGRANAIKDDLRTLVLTGSIDVQHNIAFSTDIYPALPKEANIDTALLNLPFYPEQQIEIVLRDELFVFYHFSCTKIIYRTNATSYLQLRYLGNYYNTNITTVLRKWHNEAITSVDNISFKPL